MKYAIQIDSLTKSFGDLQVLNGISFSVEAGTIFGFLGPNGAGKTTTIRCMMDFIRPISGSITLLGKGAQSGAVELKNNIGYLSGNVHVYPDWTGQQHIDFFSALNGGAPLAGSLIERFNFDSSLKTKYLSSGNKQKLGLILAFMHKPKLIILDEPTNALDPLLQNEVYKLIEESRTWGATVFMSSHNLTEVQRICDRVAIIKDGQLVAEETIASLQQRSLYVITAQLSKPLPASALQQKDITVLLHTNSVVQVKIKGQPNDILKQLNAWPIADIEIAHASLEDIFLEHYQ